MSQIPSRATSERTAKPFTPENAILWLKAQARHYDEQMHFLEADAYRSIVATIESLVSENTLRWVPLAERLPTETKGTFLIHHPDFLDRQFPGHPMIESNPEYIREHAIREGYTHWYGPIPRPEWMVHELDKESERG